jgi:hypothetical protein
MSSKPWSRKKLTNSEPKVFLAVTGITVSPAVTRLDLSTDPGSFRLIYTNSTAHPIQLTFSAKDFASLEEGWHIKFLDKNDSLNYRYSLSSWLQFSPSSLLLPPGTSLPLRVDVRRESLSAGGHYASIIADIATAPPTPEAIAIKSQLVSLVFVRANTGFEHDAARIAGFSAASADTFSLPQQYTLRFDNSGNTELVPHGLVIVRNALNREVARGILNEDSLITLPESIRRYDIPITVQSGRWLLPGPYQASLTVSYGTNQSLSSYIQFMSFGHRLNLIMIILIPTVILVLLRLILKKMPRRQNLRPKLG